MLSLPHGQLELAQIIKQRGRTVDDRSLACSFETRMTGRLASKPMPQGWCDGLKSKP